MGLSAVRTRLEVMKPILDKDVEYRPCILPR